jgi:hypothetical protein
MIIASQHLYMQQNRSEYALVGMDVARRLRYFFISYSLIAKRAQGER